MMKVARFCLIEIKKASKSIEESVEKNCMLWDVVDCNCS